MTSWGYTAIVIDRLLLGGESCSDVVTVAVVRVNLFTLRSMFDCYRLPDFPVEDDTGVFYHLLSYIGCGRPRGPMI